MRTTNGGETWTSLNSTRSYWHNSIYFADANAGWTAGVTCGSKGLALKTTDGGLTWSAQVYTAASELFSIAFSTTVDGMVVGARPVPWGQD